MKIDLNEVPLDKADEQDRRSVSNINTQDERNVASFDAPGTQGSTYSDLGRSAVRITFDGIVTGPNARPMLEGIWTAFKKGEPVPFNSELSGAADITKVLIEEFTVKTAVGERDRYDYSIALWEYKEPPEEPEAPGGESGEAVETPEDEKKKEDAEKWANKTAADAEKSKNELSGTVLDVDGTPVKGAKVKIKGPKQELSVTTDENGEYTAKDLEPGAYVVTVEGEDFKEEEEIVYVS